MADGLEDLSCGNAQLDNLSKELSKI